MAVNSIGLHLLAVVVWVGGLVALPFAASGETSERASVLVKRYSALALAAFAVTAISGSANALVRIQIDQLFTTTYGKTNITAFGLGSFCCSLEISSSWRAFTTYFAHSFTRA